MFSSPALINDERVLIGVDEAEVIKEQVISRGLCFEPQDSPSSRWMEIIIRSFRDSTTAPGFDHEFWGAWTLMPPWARRLVSISHGGWLDFPEKPSDLTAESLGRKVGDFLTLTELKLQSVMKDEKYRSALEHSEWMSAVRGLVQDEAQKVSIEFPGFENVLQMASESFDAMMPLRSLALGIVGTQPMETCGQFSKGFISGWQRARKVDVFSELSTFNLRMDVIEQLFTGWDHVAQLKTRTDVSEFVLRHLPKAKQKYFKDDEQRWESFRGGVLRDLFKEIGLNPGARGRPRKNGATSQK